jgi:hypothetical protein
MYYPVYRHVQCTNGNCGYALSVTPERLALTASRFACPLCHTITQFAEVQAQQPGISQEAKDFWGGVAKGAVAVGVFLFVKQVIEWADS